MSSEKMALAVLKRGLASMHIDEEQVYHKTKLLLKIYRDVVWCIEDRVCEIEAEYYAMGGSRLAEALDYLDDYDPNINKKDLEEKLCSLLKSKWLIEIVDKALLKIKNYPDYGDLYFNILYKQYIVKTGIRKRKLLNLSIVRGQPFIKEKKKR